MSAPDGVTFGVKLPPEHRTMKKVIAAAGIGATLIDGALLGAGEASAHAGREHGKRRTTG